MVEDEESITEPLAEALEREGFATRVAGTVAAALEEAGREPPDLVLLDVMLPDGSGYDVCRELRRHSEVPIIMLTARGEEADRVIGLELGADDYVVTLGRLFPALLLAAAVWWVLAPAAGAAGSVSRSAAIRQLDDVRRSIDQTLVEVKDGKAPQAFAEAKAGYLNHFELVEIPLRIVAPRLTADAETKFAEIRGLISGGASTGQVRDAIVELRRLINDSERELTSTGVGAPSVVAGQSFLIIFREGLEAVLLLSALLGYLEAAKASQYRRPVVIGMGAAVVASVVMFFVLRVVLDSLPFGREVLEAVTAIVATVVLFYVSFWLIARLEQRETVWGHDLRVEGIVVEPMHGMDDLVAAVHDFGPSPRRRLGILVDHLVAGSKETRAVQELLRQQGMAENVLVTGHPYVDVWEAVKPATVGIRAWPQIPRGTDWKTGVCDALRWGEPADGARRVLGAVRAYTDLETPLIGAVERLIDFVTELGE